MLLRPPQLFYFGVWPHGPRLSVPLGLLAIGSYLKRHGLDVGIYDAFVEGDGFTGDEVEASVLAMARGLTQRLAKQIESGDHEASERMDGPGHKLHLGASWERIRRDLRAMRPDIVGITNLFRENTEETLKAAALVREVLPDAVILAGGPNASALPEYMLERSPAIDAVGVGDGEDIMLEIAAWVRGEMALEDIRGIVRRDEDGSIVRNAKRDFVTDLDQFGPIDYGLVRLERYFSYERNGIMARNKLQYSGAERSVSLITSRGCPYKCVFCSIHIHAGRKYRRYSVETVLDEIETLVRDHGVHHIHIEDDNLTLDRARFMELMDGILDRGLRFTWDTPNGVHASALDEEMLRRMKETGCTYLIIGVESGDQWVLDNIVHKTPLRLAQVTSVFEMGKRVGLDLQAFYVIGFPRETMAQIRATLFFAAGALQKFDVVPHVAIARADPGTELYEEAKEHGNLVTDYSVTNIGGVHTDMFVRHLIKNDEFTPEDLEAISQRFHQAAIRTIGHKTALCLARHPIVAGRVARYTVSCLRNDHAPIRDTLIKLFFCNLFYRHALLKQGEFEHNGARNGVRLASARRRAAEELRGG